MTVVAEPAATPLVYARSASPRAEPTAKSAWTVANEFSERRSFIRSRRHRSSSMTSALSKSHSVDSSSGVSRSIQVGSDAPNAWELLVFAHGPSTSLPVRTPLDLLLMLSPTEIVESP